MDFNQEINSHEEMTTIEKKTKCDIKRDEKHKYLYVKFFKGG